MKELPDDLIDQYVSRRLPPERMREVARVVLSDDELLTRVRGTRRRVEHDGGHRAFFRRAFSEILETVLGSDRRPRRGGGGDPPGAGPL